VSICEIFCDVILVYYHTMMSDLCATSWCQFVKYLLVQTICHANKIDVHCSCKMSDELDMVSYITKENKRRKRGRIVLMK
jgi:hypothetical protein